MRRIPAKYAQSGMVLSRAVYDSCGNILFDRGVTLAQDSGTLLEIHGVRELLVEDPRVNDVSVQPLIAPELEAEAGQAMRTLMTESWGSEEVDPRLFDLVQKPAASMARELCGDAIGEVNTAGCSLDEFMFYRPARVAGLSLLMGKMAGFKLNDLLNLAQAALLLDVGYISLPRSLIGKAESLTEKETGLVRNHPEIGAKIVAQSGRFFPAVGEIIRDHHERWDGSGYPRGLRGNDLSLAVRIIAISDSYFELVSERPGRPALMPHEAAEFIMAYGGELFDPGFVQMFARNVPLYPTGTTVKLNTGELGIISNGNLGHVGRPVVRLCTDNAHKPLPRPIDIDLSRAEYQKRLIVQALA